MERRLEIDLSRVSGYVDGEEDKVITRNLRKAGLFSNKFLYSVFNGRRTNQVKKTGSYRAPEHENVFAFELKDLKWDSGALGDPNCIKTHSRQYDRPAIGVYHASMLEKMRELDFEYKFLCEDKRKAVAAIAFLKFC